MDEEEIKKPATKIFKHTVVVYGINGEHFMFDCDDVIKCKETLRIVKEMPTKDDIADDRELELIGEFLFKNIIGWEQIR